MDFKTIAESVKRSLSHETCREHGKHATIVISGSSDKPSFTITGCCDAFCKSVRDKAVGLMKKTTAEHVRKEIDDMFRKFRK